MRFLDVFFFFAHFFTDLYRGGGGRLQIFRC